ncbi:hypothetical protein MSG28_005989 [Choristoneura fumiferana]|uniref:Uncharacterized protein n=1 Tax=Choristoneura fumiferana TaxID=7141 RepID=A0ACC0L1K9_CHOFU|nr:hypothetical protein MSG28_005989 [Choristoneura fumiferana]
MGRGHYARPPPLLPSRREYLRCANESGRGRVPDMGRGHYARPPPLLPSRREYLRCANVLKKQSATSDYSASSDDDAPAPVCLRLECARHAPPPPPPPPPAPLRPATNNDADDDLKAISEHKTYSSSSSQSDSDTDYESAPKRRRAASPATALRRAVDDQLSKLDHHLVKLLAWQRLQQILVGEQCYGPWSRLPLAAETEALLHAAIPRARLAKHGFKHVALPSELLSRAERERIARAVWGAAPPPPRPHAPAPSHAPHRAAACPVLRPGRLGLGDGLGPAVPMRLSRLTFGADCMCH